MINISDTTSRVVPERRQTHHDATAEVAITLWNITSNGSFAYFVLFDHHYRVGMLLILDIEVEDSLCY